MGVVRKNVGIKRKRKCKKQKGAPTSGAPYHACFFSLMW